MAGRFRFIDAGERWRLERREQDGSWRLNYDFSFRRRRLAESAAMCHYHQTSPDSHFTRNRICSIARPSGRVTLSGRRLILTTNGKKEEQLLAMEADWYAALRDHFGIVLDALDGDQNKNRTNARPAEAEYLGRGGALHPGI